MLHHRSCLRLPTRLLTFRGRGLVVVRKCMGAIVVRLQPAGRGERSVRRGRGVARCFRCRRRRPRAALAPGAAALPRRVTSRGVLPCRARRQTPVSPLRACPRGAAGSGCRPTSGRPAWLSRPYSAPRGAVAGGKSRRNARWFYATSRALDRSIASPFYFWRARGPRRRPAAASPRGHEGAARPGGVPKCGDGRLRTAPALSSIISLHRPPDAFGNDGRNDDAGRGFRFSARERTQSLLPKRKTRSGRLIAAG